MTPTLRAFAQLDDPAFLSAVLFSVAAAALAFVAVGGGLVWGADWLARSQAPGQAGWLAWVAGVAGVAGAVVLALYLFVPVATGIATLFVDSVAGAVERRHYPGLPPAQPVSLGAQAWDGVALGLNVLAMQLVALLLSLLLPGAGLVLGWLVAAWAIGRGLFMAVAMRRHDRPTARMLYRRNRFAVLVQGGLVAAGGLVPVLNLAAPVLGLAAMVHVLMRAPPGGLSR